MSKVFLKSVRSVPIEDDDRQFVVGKVKLASASGHDYAVVDRHVLDVATLSIGTASTFYLSNPKGGNSESEKILNFTVASGDDREQFVSLLVLSGSRG